MDKGQTLEAKELSSNCSLEIPPYLDIRKFIEWYTQTIDLPHLNCEVVQRWPYLELLMTSRGLQHYNNHCQCGCGGLLTLIICDGTVGCLQTAEHPLSLTVMLGT